MEKLLCIVGPTASGKTALAVALARQYNGEVVSADSMQLYRRMDVGTAKPDATERAGVPHHMLDVLEPWETCSAERYALLARACVEDICARGRLPIVAGGTGLYVDALLGRVSPPPPGDPAIRAALERFAAEAGPSALHERLQAADPVSAARLHENDVRRVVRALEVVETTGRPLGAYAADAPPPLYEPAFIGLRPADRAVLYRRIDRRVDAMLAHGLWDEARALWEDGRMSETARMAIGYKELFACFDGQCTPDEAVGLIKRNTRRYAKRQLTWFGRDPSVRWLETPENVNFQLILRLSRDLLESYGIM